MKKSLLSFLFLSAAVARMADEAPAAPEVAQAPAPVTVEVPAEHADLIQRAVELLKKGEQFVVDNIHAGLSVLEGLFKSEDADAPANEDVPNA